MFIFLIWPCYLGLDSTQSLAILDLLIALSLLLSKHLNKSNAKGTQIPWNASEFAFCFGYFYMIPTSILKVLLTSSVYKFHLRLLSYLQ